MCTPTSMGIRVSRRGPAWVFGTPIPNRIFNVPFLQAGRYMPQTKFFLPLALHAVQRAIGGSQELFNRCATVRIYGHANAYGDRRRLAIVLQLFADSRGCLRGV